jgi:hypothetical protein
MTWDMVLSSEDTATPLERLPKKGAIIVKSESGARPSKRNGVEAPPAIAPSEQQAISGIRK